MNISDLNYLEVFEESDIAGGTYSKPYLVDKNIKVRKDIDVEFYKQYKIKVKPFYGNVAEAEALGQAYGDNSFSNTLTNTYADGYYSESISESDSVVYP